eukprot:TRINITY_DN113025_c0_g1_i1.p1 TRINITY_DN113025_c0_g1~~TRINITY_DN113025_c0_g1_i1.p1  ORF type:complete len:663 (+),score=86.96 TRINITY_DN113025_c0_g1_i1:88-1989(+)
MEAYYDKSYEEGANEYNIWYHKYYGHGTNRKMGDEKEKAQHRCNVKKDSGWTKGFEKDDTYICVYYARGCCALGAECPFIHMIPTEQHEENIDQMHDCFGRERHATDKTDMAGVGNFNRECKSLWVGCLKAEPGTNLDEVVFRHFYEWGDIDYVRTVPERNFAYVKYKRRTSAEFAKVAMDGQSLDGEEIIDIKWGIDDPSAEFWEQEQDRKKNQVMKAFAKKGINLANFPFELVQTEGNDIGSTPAIQMPQIRSWDTGASMYLDAGAAPQLQFQLAVPPGGLPPTTTASSSTSSVGVAPGMQARFMELLQSGSVSDTYINSDSITNIYNQAVGPIDYAPPKMDPMVAVEARLAGKDLVQPTKKRVNTKSIKALADEEENEAADIAALIEEEHRNEPDEEELKRQKKRRLEALKRQEARREAENDDRWAHTLAQKEKKDKMKRLENKALNAYKKQLGVEDDKNEHRTPTSSNRDRRERDRTATTDKKRNRDVVDVDDDFKPPTKRPEKVKKEERRNPHERDWGASSSSKQKVPKGRDSRWVEDAKREEKKKQKETAEREASKWARREQIIADRESKANETPEERAVRKAAWREKHRDKKKRFAACVGGIDDPMADPEADDDPEAGDTAESLFA